MNGINGIETAKKLRSFDKDCLLIFTTTSTDHALEGFQVRATHYLVKPYTDKDLSALTEELLSRIPEPDRYIEIKVNGSDVQLPFKDIIYAEHFSHMIHIYTTGGQTLVTRQSFENFTAPLKEDPRFFPSSRGTIVNLEHAIGFDNSAFVMKDGSTVLISRKLLKTARQALMDFLFQGGVCHDCFFTSVSGTYSGHPGTSSCVSASECLSEAFFRQTALLGDSGLSRTFHSWGSALPADADFHRAGFTVYGSGCNCRIYENPACFRLEIRQCGACSLCGVCLSQQYLQSFERSHA